jgi:hypothetical protein
MSSQPTLWQFDKIADQDSDRAKALQTAPSRAEISQKIVAALNVAVLGGSVHIGLDQFRQTERAIIQFHVGQQLYDWFLNAHTGYRAQFRISWICGQAYNAELVQMLRDELRRDLESKIEVRCLDSFEDIGCKRVPRNRILSSLVPELSKVWICTRLIGLDGNISDLPFSLSGPRLVFNEDESWAAPYVSESAAWLDLKGAFLGVCGPFQIKDPIQRSKDLQRNGSA